MFEKDKARELYTREDFTFEEQLFEKYMEMRKIVNTLENKKYSVPDNFADKETYKQGFLAGVKIMSSIFIDI